MDVEEGIRKGIRAQPRPAPSRSRQRDPDTSCWGWRRPGFPPRPGPGPGPWSQWCRQQPPTSLSTERLSPGERWGSLPEEHRRTLWGPQLSSSPPSPSPLWPWTVGRGTRSPKTKPAWSSSGEPVDMFSSVVFSGYLEGQRVFILLKLWRPPVVCCLLCSCVKTCTICWMEARCDLKEQNGPERRIRPKGCETDQHQHQDNAAGSSLWLGPSAVQQPFTTLGQMPLWDFQQKCQCSNTIKPFSLFFFLTSYCKQLVHVMVLHTTVFLTICFCTSAYVWLSHIVHVSLVWNAFLLRLCVVLSYCQ